MDYQFVKLFGTKWVSSLSTESSHGAAVITYIGYELSRGEREPGTEQNEAICRTPLLQMVKGLRTFLGLTGWCRLWIYNYGIIVRPLCELLKNNPTRLI